MPKFSWEVFFASAAAIMLVGIAGALLLKKRVNPETGEITVQFAGTGPNKLTGYTSIDPSKQ